MRLIVYLGLIISQGYQLLGINVFWINRINTLALKNVVGNAFEIDGLIREQRTGTAKELAAKLAVSERHVYNYLRAFNEIGRTNTFDDDKQSYVYKETQ